MASSFNKAFPSTVMLAQHLPYRLLERAPLRQVPARKNPTCLSWEVWLVEKPQLPRASSEPVHAILHTLHRHTLLPVSSCLSNRLPSSARPLAETWRNCGKVLVFLACCFYWVILSYLQRKFELWSRIEAEWPIVDSDGLWPSTLPSNQTLECRNVYFCTSSCPWDLCSRR